MHYSMRICKAYCNELWLCVSHTKHRPYIAIPPPLSAKL